MVEKSQFNYIKNSKPIFIYFVNRTKQVLILHLAIIGVILSAVALALLMLDGPCRNKRVETIGNVIEVGTRCLD